MQILASRYPAGKQVQVWGIHVDHRVILTPEKVLLLDERRRDKSRKIISYMLLLFTSSLFLTYLFEKK